MIERKRSLVPVSEPPLTRTEAPADRHGGPGRDGQGSEHDRDDHDRDDHDRDDDAPPPPPRRRLAVFVAIPVALLLGFGAWTHWRTRQAAVTAQAEQRDFVPEVRTAKAKRLTDPVELTQPGQTVAFETANVFARSTGYVAERLVDIGSRVHKGDLLIRIAAPDLDQQLVQAQAQVGQNEAAVLQAQANLQQAQATVKLADVTKSRTTTLANQGWETKQNADNSTANAATGAAGVSSAQAGIAVALANLRAQQATVQRLQELTGFERITAPFDGVVTARNVDVGNLLTADNGSGTPMLSISRDDVLRVAVYVPQSGAVGVHAGLPAKVTIPELPGRSFDAHVSRTAQSLDPSSRSMLTEVDIDNKDGSLRAGLYANVSIAIPRDKPGVVVPDAALVFNADGLQAVSLDGEDRAHYHKIAIYRDFGTTAELREGLAGDETLVLSPPPNLAEGDKVKVAPPPEANKDGGNEQGKT